MKIAIPVNEGKLSMHFGHCDKFYLVTVDRPNKAILSEEFIIPPPHQPGILPGWLAEQGAECIIAGGMGGKAQQLFQKNNISIITGAPAKDVKEIISEYLNNTLVTGDNTCDH